jgi:competence protein ComEC
VFYLFLAIMILIPGRFTRYSCVGIMIWLILILFGVAMPRGSDELRVTVLAVGHGNCTVLECPDGRVLLVDVGTLAGPDATRRVIAPYLWSRGIRRIDEVFLSHADADHFNNVSELLKRFDVGSVALTPSFSAKPSDDIRLTLAAIVSRKIPMRIMLRGDQLEVGTVTLTILHPTLDGPTGSENERSMVLLVQHAGQSILLPGDLEGAGTQQVVGLPILPVDVVVAPHHGSRGAWTEGFRTWARPKFVVVSRGSGLGVPIGAGAAGNGVPIWDTPSFGAVTLRSHASGLTAESFLQQERQVVSRGNGSR